MGNVGKLTSAVQPVKSNPVVPAGKPLISVSPAPEITRFFGKPVHPVRFIVLHVTGKEGTDVKVVFPDKSIEVSLVEADKFRTVNDEGNPVNEVIFGGV